MGNRGRNVVHIVRMSKMIQIFCLAFLLLLCYYRHGRKAKRYWTASGSCGDNTTSSVFESAQT